MAEPFSALTGALQVADFGANVCSTLYKYAKDVKSAKGDIHALAEDIELVSSALKQTAQFLELEAGSRIFNDEGRATAYRAVEQCRGTFREIQGMVQAYYRKLPNGQTVSSTFEAFKHPLKADKLLALRQRLEWPKNTLMLHLTVGLHRRHLSSKDTLTEQMERLQIRNLFDKLKETDRRSENMKAEMKAVWTEWYAEQQTKAMQSCQSPMSTLAPVTTCNIALPAQLNDLDDQKRSDDVIERKFNRATATTREGDRILPLITKCTTRAAALSQTLTEASRIWTTTSVLLVETISQALTSTGSAVQALQREHERALAPVNDDTTSSPPASVPSQCVDALPSSDGTPVLPWTLTTYGTSSHKRPKKPRPDNQEELAVVVKQEDKEGEHLSKSRKISPEAPQNDRAYITAQNNLQHSLLRGAPFSRQVDTPISPNLLPEGASAFERPPSYQMYRRHARAAAQTKPGADFRISPPPSVIMGRVPQEQNMASAEGLDLDAEELSNFAPDKAVIEPAQIVSCAPPASGIQAQELEVYDYFQFRPQMGNRPRAELDSPPPPESSELNAGTTDKPTNLFHDAKMSGMDVVDFLILQWTGCKESRERC